MIFSWDERAVRGRHPVALICITVSGLLFTRYLHPSEIRTGHRGREWKCFRIYMSARPISLGLMGRGLSGELCPRKFPRIFPLVPVCHSFLRAAAFKPSNFSASTSMEFSPEARNLRSWSPRHADSPQFSFYRVTPLVGTGFRARSLGRCSTSRCN